MRRRLHHRGVVGLHRRSARRRSRPGCRGRRAARAAPYRRLAGTAATGSGRLARADHPDDGAHGLPPVRRPRRLLHRGRRRPRPRPPQRPARLGRPGRRGARPRRTDDFGYANLAIRGRKLRRDPRRAARAGAGARARPGHDLRRRQRHHAAARRRRRARSTGTTRRWAGWPRPAPRVWCSRPSTRAARRSTGRCAAGSRSTTSWCARSPTGTAPPSWTSGGCGEYRDWRYWDEDRMHMGPAGHQRMAIEVLDTLGVAARPRRRCRPDRPVGEPPSGASAAREPRVGRALRRPVGAPPPHRPVLGRQREPKRPDARADRPARRPRVPHPRRRPGICAPADCGCSSVGRARPSQGRCREFESRHPLRVLSQGSWSRSARHSAHRRRREFESRHPLRVLSQGAWSRSARHSAHRRCREFESRHPLRAFSRPSVATTNAPVTSPSRLPHFGRRTGWRAQSSVNCGRNLVHQSVTLTTRVTIVDSGVDVTPEVSRLPHVSPPLDQSRRPRCCCWPCPVRPPGGGTSPTEPAAAAGRSARRRR